MTSQLKDSGLFDKELVPFYVYYTVLFMGTATILTFLNIYFQEELGFSLAQIGIIASMGPVVTMIAQPWLGILSDRTNRRKVLLVLFLGSIMVSVLFPLHYAFMYVAVMSVLNTLFNNSISPLGDAITLQFLETKRIKFNTIRMIGTISYALMAAVAGYIINDNLTRVFYIKAISMGIGLFAVFWMPDLQKSIKNTKEKATTSLKDSLKELLKNKMVLCILFTSFIFGLAMTFYHAFIGIQLRYIGATEVQVGTAVFLSAASEVPVLILVNKIFGNKKPIHLLMLVGFFMTIRLILLFFADAQGSLVLIYINQLLHGLTFMVQFYFTVVLLNKYSPVQIKSTVQTLNAVVRAFAAFIGAGLGGTLADQIGIGMVYLALSIFVFLLCFILPGVASIIYREQIKGMKSVNSTSG